jgi:LacI family transcriptional regulator
MDFEADETRGNDGAATERPKRAPTMTDVAERAGVSQTTVSLVLNGAVGARLSALTRQRVQEAARTLGYRMVRRGQVRAAPQETRSIGFVVDEMSTDPWCAIALDGAREKAWEYGLTLTIRVTRGDPEMEEAVLQQLASEPIQGLIYGTIQTRRIVAAPALLNCYVADRSLPSIVPAEVLGGRVATDHLIAAGHRRIGIIEGEGRMDSSLDRLKGYRQALASHDIPFEPALVRPGNWEPPAGYEQTLELMRLPKPPTAIFCCNDMMALGSYEALKSLGLDIPGDVSVVGYDDREIAHFARPPLTTVLLPHREMGALAAETLIDGAASLKRKAIQTKVDCPLIERASVRPPRLR